MSQLSRVMAKIDAIPGITAVTRVTDGSAP
jgi:hypothetical protein